MARGWHYVKVSLSSALRLSFSGMCILLFLFLYLCRFVFVCCVFLLLSLELCRCSSDLFLSGRQENNSDFSLNNNTYVPVLLYIIQVQSVCT